MSGLETLTNVAPPNICRSNSDIVVKTWRGFVSVIRVAGRRLIQHPKGCVSTFKLSCLDGTSLDMAAMHHSLSDLNLVKITELIFIEKTNSRTRNQNVKL